ncbi:MAG: helix-turn-helix protein, partial [Neobacillus sp.]|nr:helix-turn-helix protein [Neobacillus sp.]
MEIGERIVLLREKKGLRQKDLADKVNLNVSVMNRIEKGTRPITDSEIVRLADAPEISTEYLLGRTPITPTYHEDKEFQEFLNDPNLGLWFKELKDSPEEKVNELRKIWEIIKSRETGL